MIDVATKPRRRGLCNRARAPFIRKRKLGAQNPSLSLGAVMRKLVTTADFKMLAAGWVTNVGEGGVV